jgi:large subunit ribosomal protein L21
MKYAVVESGGKQYIARPGETIEVDHMSLDIGTSIDFKDVLLVVDGSTLRIGQPVVKGAVVKGKVVDQIKGRKILVFKYKPRIRYRRKQGHRQRYTRVTIEGINLPKAAAEKAEATPKAAAPKKTAPAKKKPAAKAEPKAKKPAVEKPAAAKKPAAKKTTAAKQAARKTTAKKTTTKTTKPAAKKTSTTKKSAGSTKSTGTKRSTGTKKSTKKSSSTKKNSTKASSGDTKKEKK